MGQHSRHRRTGDPQGLAGFGLGIRGGDALHYGPASFKRQEGS
jgi:hypothetical protein